jgi:hypothetical protein
MSERMTLLSSYFIIKMTESATLSPYFIIEMTLRFFLDVEHAQVVTDGGELREDEGHRKMLAEGDREFHSGHVVSVNKIKGCFKQKFT